MTANNKKKNTVLKTKTNRKSKDQEKKSPNQRSGRKATSKITPSTEQTEPTLPPPPLVDITFKAFLTARCCSAVWGTIMDCDETYNYWEPAHFLLYGKGFQTWEYNPNYALRSYLYLLLHVAPAWVYATGLRSNRLAVFYFVRCFLAFLCALCETYFFKAVNRKFGGIVAGLTGAFLAFSPGMFIASTAFLPSSFSMYACLFLTGAWLNGKYELAIYATSLGVFLGWPFSALIAVPLAFDLLYFKKQYAKFLIWSIYSAFINLVPMLKIDSEYYGRFVAAPVNIVLYNVFGKNGSTLYGTEPFTFYFINAFLNFNVAFIFALLAPLLIFARNYVLKRSDKVEKLFCSFSYLAPFYIWFAFFSLQPHKEERFLFPAYPILCLCGAIGVDSLDIFITEMKQIARGFAGKFYNFLERTQSLSVAVIFVTVLMGVSRILALHIGYQAPLEIYMEFNKIYADSKVLQSHQINVCVGKEWYRFPNSFFLPYNNWHLRFLKSEFKGQLPAEYAQSKNATAIVHPHFNDMNLEEDSRYFNIENCHFLVDYDTGVYTDLEPNYLNRKDKWKLMMSSYFLNKKKSNAFFRAFFVPFLSKRFTHFSDYNLFISTKFLSEHTAEDLNIRFTYEEA